MSRVPPRQLARWDSDLTKLIVYATEIRDAGPTILAVAQQADSGDGYPASLRGSDGQPKGGHGDPVLDTVTNRAGGKLDEDTGETTADTWHGVSNDTVAEWVVELTRGIDQTRRTMLRLARLKDMIVNRKDPRVYDVGGHCKACGRYVSGSAADRLRNLYCEACNRAWLRWVKARDDEHLDAPHHLFEKLRHEAIDRGEERAS